MQKIQKYILYLGLGLLSGTVCGFCGVVFSKTLGFVTQIRQNNTWLIWFLIAGGLLSVFIYKLCRVRDINTTNVFDCVKTEQNLPTGLPVAIFCGTAISHLLGASTGREGAALQIGGGVANTISRVFKLDEDARHITVMCGMAALFSALFGTPLAACVFVIEVILTRICFLAAVPVLASSVTAFLISTSLGVHPERFNIGTLPHFSLSLLWKTAVITLACILVAFVFCKCLNGGKALFKKIFKNEYLRISIGGAIIILLTLLIGNFDYNGGGIDIIERVFDGTVKYEAFALKIVFTVICISAGFKGGEIIPTLFIGATLGGALATVLSLPIGTGAAVGMAVLFCAATKCPFATILMCCEMFGFSCAPLIIPVVIISFCAARYQGLYNNTKDLLQCIMHNDYKFKSRL